MSSKRVYRRVKVKDISTESIETIAGIKGSGEATVGLDIAKQEIVSVIRWSDGSFERPWSVCNPSEIGLLIERLCFLKGVCGGLTVGLESTGTYGESVRFALTKAGIDVHRVSGKGVSDYKEIFDGVPSQHDGKDAAMIAELTFFGKGTPWPFVLYTEAEQQMRHQVARLDAFRNQANQWMGRLEGMLARHWPELTNFLKLHSVTLLNICVEYGSPSNLAADASAREQLRKWGGPRLSFPKIEAIIGSAETTAGVAIGPGEMVWLKEIASEVIRAKREFRQCDRELQAFAKSHEDMQHYVKEVGVVTLCVLWTITGDPANYSSSGAFIKALGLNLKELSSGKRQGHLAISKRGSGLARKYLFFWALRAVQLPELSNWYTSFQKVGRGKSNGSEHRKMKALIALMRKLCRALWYVRKHNLTFDYAKVFPGKPLQPRRSRRRRKPLIHA
jgi:transposase